MLTLPPWRRGALTCDGGDARLAVRGNPMQPAKPGGHAPEIAPKRRPERISNEVGHAGVSGRKKCLQDFDSQTHRESKSDRARQRDAFIFRLDKNMHKRRNREE